MSRINQREVGKWTWGRSDVTSKSQRNTSATLMPSVCEETRAPVERFIAGERKIERRVGAATSSRHVDHICGVHHVVAH